MKPQQTELQLHQQVCQYIRLKYPKAIFNSDMAGSMKLTIGQASRINTLRSSRGFPDVVIYEPRMKFSGCFIELKREGYKLFNKKGEYKTKHLKEQHAMLRKLFERGYYAVFAVGFDEARKHIDVYMDELLEGEKF
jgi:hypothetical protein